MSEELKSAFEIPGFLEGKTKIKLPDDDREFFVRNRNIHFNRGGSDHVAVAAISHYLKKQWSPVPEKKKKLYRHEFWFEDDGLLYDNYRSKVTDKTWDEFSEGLGHLTHIRSEEVGE